MRLLVSILLAHVVASAAGSAQDQVVSTELVTLSLDGGVPIYFLRSAGKVAELQATPQGIGAPLAYRGPRSLPLYAERAAVVPAEPGDDPPKPVLRVRLPVGQDRVLLVFSRKGSGEGQVPVVRALGISSRELRDGDYRVFNFSRQPVFAVLNDKKATIPPGKPVDLSAPAWRSETLDMEVKLGLREEGKTRVVYSSVWGHRPGRRMFLFILDRPDKFRPLDLRRFFDSPRVKDAGDPGD